MDSMDSNIQSPFLFFPLPHILLNPSDLNVNITLLGVSAPGPPPQLLH